MTTDRELDEILAELGREHRAQGPPARLEGVLCDAARDRRAGGRTGARAGLRWRWAAAAALLVAVATMGTLWQMGKRAQPKVQQVQSAPEPRVSAEARPVAAPVAEKGRAAAERWRRGGRGAERAGSIGTSEKQRRWSSLDEFVALPVSEGLAPASDLSVVRIRLKGSDLQQYGLQAPADAAAQTMLAEFVVGEDGLPRAIRIVR